METQGKEIRPFSYHTFLLPFEIVDGNKERKLDSEDIVEKIKANGNYWEEIKKDNIDSLFDAVILKESEKKRQKKIIQAIKYNQEQYFHENVKKTIHNYDESNIVHEFVFNFDKTSEKSCSIKSLEKEYIINVSNIRLKVFNTGVCILILEMYNNDYRNLKSVKEINALGRQISLPYIAQDSGEISCAQEITWNFLHNKTYSFKEKNEGFWKSDEPQEETYTIDLISNIIIGEEKGDNYKVIPSVDDRMFTCSLIQDDKGYIDDIERDDRASKSLYEYIYIDKDGNCSAPTFEFRKDVLDASLYRRWAEFGTLYGASHTSLVAISGEGDALETIVTRPFLTQYVEIAILVLAQRASILRFQKQIINDIEKKNIQELQAKYIDYRNQLHFFEISPQEQGLELYELIKKQLYIEKEVEVLEKNLGILYEKVNIDNSYMYSQFGIIIGLFAMGSFMLELFGFILGTEGGTDFFVQLCALKWKILGMILFFIVLLILLYKFAIKKFFK